MSVWAGLVGQEPAVATLVEAAGPAGAMTHAWLFTGPPGSGRSVAASSYASAYLYGSHQASTPWWSRVPAASEISLSSFTCTRG